MPGPRAARPARLTLAGSCCINARLRLIPAPGLREMLGGVWSVGPAEPCCPTGQCLRAWKVRGTPCKAICSRNNSCLVVRQGAELTELRGGTV